MTLAIISISVTWFSLTNSLIFRWQVLKNPTSLCILIYANEQAVHQYGRQVNMDASDVRWKLRILVGLRYGFKLNPKSDPFCLNNSELENYSSATCPDFKPDIDHLFLKELELRCISKIDSKPHCVHSIGRVAKKIPTNFAL